MAIERSAAPADAAFTVVFVVELLLARSGSETLLLTDAVFVTVPGCDGAVTTIVTLADALGARLGNVHVTTPPVVQLPPALGVADCRVAPDGTGSVMTTFVAVFGPLFVVAMKYVSD